MQAKRCGICCLALAAPLLLEGQTPTSSMGVITIAGSEKQVQSPSTSSTGSLVISGGHSTRKFCVINPSVMPVCVLTPVAGDVTISINGFSVSTPNLGVSLGASMARAIAAGFNSPGSPVSATAKNQTVSFKSVSVGSQTNYPIRIASDDMDFSCESASTATMSGGSDGALIYDSGTVATKISGLTSSPVSWGPGSTPVSIANDLAVAVQNAAGALVRATTPGDGTVVLRSVGSGAATDFPVSVLTTDTVGSATTPSFQAFSTGLSGGTDGIPPTILSASSPSGTPGPTPITLTGAHFTSGRGALSLNGGLLPVVSWSDDTIVFTVPQGSHTGAIRAIVGDMSSNPFPFIVTGGPACPAN